MCEGKDIPERGDDTFKYIKTINSLLSLRRVREKIAKFQMVILMPYFVLQVKWGHRKALHKGKIESELTLERLGRWP